MNNHSGVIIERIKYSDVVIIKYPDQSVYDGYLNINEQRNGYGEIRYINGDSYVGLWENDKKHGIGQLCISGKYYIIEYKYDIITSKTNTDIIKHNNDLIEYIISKEWKYDHLGLLKYF